MKEKCIRPDSGNCALDLAHLTGYRDLIAVFLMIDTFAISEINAETFFFHTALHGQVTRADNTRVINSRPASS